MTPMFILVVALAAAPAAPAPAPAVHQETFASPEKAAEALVAAGEKFDTEALKKILGPDGVELVVTGDTVMDKQQASAFVERYKEKHRIARDSKNPKSATLIIGAEDYPAPIPIVEKNGRWSFDTKAGRQEVLYRRIGRNELDAIEVCRGFVEAQDDYASERRDGASINQYAQRVISSPGKHDGLAWQNADGSWAGPVGQGIARVIAEGYTDKLEPYHGYYFKVLKGQGPAAPMGAMDYVVKGAMIGGFALAASPSDYRVTGIKTFVVSQTGVVYEKDMGPTTVEQFKAMTLYNPDKTWSAVPEK